LRQEACAFLVFALLQANRPEHCQSQRPCGRIVQCLAGFRLCLSYLPLIQQVSRNFYAIELAKADVCENQEPNTTQVEASESANSKPKEVFGFAPAAHVPVW